MTFFMTFSEFFKKNLDVKKFQNFEDINPIIVIFEGALRRLRVLPVNLADYIIVASRYDVFCDFFK